MVFHSNFCNVFEFVFEVLTNQLFVNCSGPTDFFMFVVGAKNSNFRASYLQVGLLFTKGIEPVDGALIKAAQIRILALEVGAGHRYLRELLTEVLGVCLRVKLRSIR